jgi:FkbM family methyltransferase
MTTTDWARLWRDLASQDVQASSEGQAQMLERWRKVAKQLDSSGKREGYPDPLLDFLLSRLEPEMTALDIGAGVGRWTVPIARKVARVTAVEPLAGMRQVLVERAASLEIANLEVVEAPWMDAQVPPHDVAIASHSTYTTADLLAFVRKMERSARRACYLALRVPAHDGVIGELSLRYRGRWHDSPNFIVGFNLLLSAGIYASVLMEPKPVRTWTDTTLDDAVARAKRHLRLKGPSHDAAIRDLLSRRLAFVGGAYQWPDAMRSALVYWEPRASA